MIPFHHSCDVKLQALLSISRSTLLTPPIGTPPPQRLQMDKLSAAPSPKRPPGATNFPIACRLVLGISSFANASGPPCLTRTLPSPQKSNESLDPQIFDLESWEFALARFEHPFPIMQHLLYVVNTILNRVRLPVKGGNDGNSLKRKFLPRLVSSTRIQTWTNL